MYSPSCFIVVSMQCWDSYFLNVHITYYLQLNYLVTVTYYPKDKVTIIILHIICDRICEKVPFPHTKFDPFCEF